MSGVHHIDDIPYREHAMLQCRNRSNATRPLSLVDRVLRAIAEDANNRVDAIVTVDPNDFRDICNRHGIELIEVV
jgi:hypothetical protein